MKKSFYNLLTLIGIVAVVGSSNAADLDDKETGTMKRMLRADPTYSNMRGYPKPAPAPSHRTYVPWTPFPSVLRPSAPPPPTTKPSTPAPQKPPSPTLLPGPPGTMFPTPAPTTPVPSASSEPSSQPSWQPSSQPSSQPSAFPSISAQPSAEPSSQPSSQPSAQPSSQPSSQPSIQPSSVPSGQPSFSSAPSYAGFTPGSFTNILSPDNRYRLILTGGDLLVQYCSSGFNNGGNCPGNSIDVQWRSNTSLGDSAGFQENPAGFPENLIVTDSGTNVVYSSNISFGTGDQAKKLYLPGVTSSCACQAYLCIVVDLSSGGNEYYYAINDGQDFETLTALCPALPPP